MTIPSNFSTDLEQIKRLEWKRWMDGGSYGYGPAWEFFKWHNVENVLPLMWRDLNKQGKT